MAFFSAVGNAIVKDRCAQQLVAFDLHGGEHGGFFRGVQPVFIPSQRQIIALRCARNLPSDGAPSTRHRHARPIATQQQTGPDRQHHVVLLVANCQTNPGGCTKLFGVHAGLQNECAHIAHHLVTRLDRPTR